MHIPEGLLPIDQAAGWYVPAMAFLGAGLAKLKRRLKEQPSSRPLVGLMGAFVFVVSLMPVPVPGLGTVSHPCGTPLAAILLGPFTAVALGAVALLLQALFFAHGGISSWGANILSMAVGGSFVGYGVYWLMRRLGAGLGLAAGLGGLAGDIVTYAITSFQLALALHGQESIAATWLAAFGSFMPTQIPLAIAELFFTSGVVVFVAKRRADLLDGLEVQP